MSVLPLAKRSMRIIALPLTTASRTPDSAASGHLTYVHFVTPPPKEEEGTNWLKWTTGKAADLWAGFGKAEDGTWKVRTHFEVVNCSAK
ncbi:hypothetical protein PHLCEN_2v12187 [Hermanssonia centrifuga]|uniref:Uncharacterized protein n=1 Tax=Hermanssonia centrifuga TaxID=98765 RepID=A0A2R6NHV8_9APHY|nr:hypothetical protein PHLCEN_2v12187 [Hermanssonia centrifuga]